jgi:hypothetical protein
MARKLVDAVVAYAVEKIQAGELCRSNGSPIQLGEFIAAAARLPWHIKVRFGIRFWITEVRLDVCDWFDGFRKANKRVIS